MWNKENKHMISLDALMESLGMFDLEDDNLEAIADDRPEVDASDLINPEPTLYQQRAKINWRSY
jgi:hypothetical protein